MTSSLGGTCAGASRAFTGPAERPAVPGQVGAVPSPAVPFSPSATWLRSARSGCAQACALARKVPVVSPGHRSVPRHGGERDRGRWGVPAVLPTLPPGMHHLRGRHALPHPGGPGTAGGRPLLPGLLHAGRLPQHARLLPLPPQQGKASPGHPPPPVTPCPAPLPPPNSVDLAGLSGLGSPCPGSVPTGHQSRLLAAPSHLCPCRGSGHQESFSWRPSSSGHSSSTSL